MTRAARSNGRSPATYSLAAKTAAVLLLTVTAFLTAVSGVGIGLSAVYGIYDGVSQEQLLADLTESYLDRAMHDGTNHYLSDPDGMDSWIRAWSGLYYQVKDGDGNVLSGNYQGETGLSHLEWRLTVPDSDNPAVTKDVTLHLWADSGAMHTWYRGMYRSLLFLSRYRVTNVAVCLAGLAASICLLVFLLSAAGRHPGEDGVREGAIDRVPFDLFTFFVGLLEAVMLLLLLTALPTVGGSMFSASAVLIIAVYIPAMLLLIGYAMSLAVRIKVGTVFRHTLVWICLRTVGQSLRWLFCRTRAALQAIPPVRRAFVLLLVLLALNLSVGYALMVGGYAGIFLLLVLLELVVLGACALRYALGLRRLQDGAAHLAKGEFEYRVSTVGLPDDCRVSAENLNRIGQGLADAVEQRMKSEHFRTELITNVSHDIKTPLTSIVNYVELIRQLSPTDETLCTYIDVLDRQSTRLKKLIDDLLEASKASSGVLNVIPAPCEVGVLLEQVQGEYAERLHAHDLNLIVQTPDKTLTVLADGRHLGRIFDNLMNNIIKYAQPGTRVYLDARAGLDPAAPGGSRPVAVITFRAAQHPRRGTAGAVRPGGRLPTHGRLRAGACHCAKPDRAAGREPAACHRRRPVQGAPYLPPVHAGGCRPGGFIREGNPVRTRDTLPTVHPRPARLTAPAQAGRRAAVAFPFPVLRRQSVRGAAGTARPHI